MPPSVAEKPLSALTRCVANRKEYRSARARRGRRGADDNGRCADYEGASLQVSLRILHHKVKAAEDQTDEPLQLFSFCTELEGYAVTRVRVDRVLEKGDMKRRLPEYRGQRYALEIDATLACLCFG